MNNTALQIAQTPRPAHLIRVAVPRLNKCEHIHEYLKQLETRDYDLEWAEVTETRKLNCAEWNALVSGLLTDREWLAGKGGTSSWTGPNDDRDFFQLSEAEREQWKRGAYIHVVEVVAPSGHKLYIDPQGYNYARYVGFTADSFPEPKTREEMRREEAKAEADARTAERAARILEEFEHPPAVPADHGLKFFWNGIKTKSGKLNRCHYSNGATYHYPAGTISIYAKDYERFSAEVRNVFHIENDSDIQTDYIGNDTIRIMTTHPLYAEVLKAHAAQEAHYEQVMAKRNRK